MVPLRIVSVVASVNPAVAGVVLRTCRVWPLGLFRVLLVTDVKGAPPMEYSPLTMLRLIAGAAPLMVRRSERTSVPRVPLFGGKLPAPFVDLTGPQGKPDGLPDLSPQVGERVRGSDFNEDPIVTIATLSSMEAKVEVGEHEVVFVKEGDPADIEIDAFPDRKFPAQVIEIAKNATVKNAGTEAEVTTFPVKVALDSRPPGVLPGMSSEVRITWPNCRTSRLPRLA